MTKTKQIFSIQSMTRIALSTAILCILGPISFPIAISEVPISLGILGIFLAVIILGLKEGTISVALYILLGLVGLPVFAGYTGGIAKLIGPTGGYIIGYIPLAIIAGLFIHFFKRKLWAIVTGMILAVIVCYAFGTAWLAISAHLTFQAALMAGVIPYIPFDLAKLFLSLAIGIPVHNAIAHFTGEF